MGDAAVLCKAILNTFADFNITANLLLTVSTANHTILQPKV